MITLIGSRIASPGLVFFYEGPSRECTGCKVYRVCIDNLEPERRYRVTKVTNRELDCRIHDEDKASVVEVEEAPAEAAIESKKAIEGATITLECLGCSSKRCENLCLCVPAGLKQEDRCRVIRTYGEKISRCELGLDLQKVSLQRVL